MRVVLLDYQGTLDILEPGQALQFVKDLQARGDFVCLWTGTETRVIQRENPGLAESVDRRVSKWILGREALESLEEHDVTEVVVVDDDSDMGEGMTGSFNIAKAGIARYVPAKEWKSLLG